MAFFKVYKDSLGKFRAFLKVKNHIEFITKDYKSHKDCLSAIREIQLNPSIYKDFCELEDVINQRISANRIDVIKMASVNARIDPELYSL